MWQYRPLKAPYQSSTNSGYVACEEECVKLWIVFLCQECAEQGEDYNRVKLLEISAEDAERWERKKKKKNPDPGFSGMTRSSG